MGEGIVGEGLATVLRHRQDEDRAENYDDLLVAETTAKVKKKKQKRGRLLDGCVRSVHIARGQLNSPPERYPTPPPPQPEPPGAINPQGAKKGLHAGGDSAPPPPRVTDLSLDARKARSYLPHLQRESDVRAVVEYVFSGSRFKVCEGGEGWGMAVCGWIVSSSYWHTNASRPAPPAHAHTPNPPPPPPLTYLQ